MSESPRRHSTAALKLALRLADAAAALDVSVEFFNANVRPEVRLVRRGRVKLVPVSELQRWLDENAAYAVEL
jgi:hypothetical protein